MMNNYKILTDKEIDDRVDQRIANLEFQIEIIKKLDAIIEGKPEAKDELNDILYI